MLRVKTSVMCVVVLLVVSVIGVAVGISVDDELQEDDPVEIYDWHELDAVRDDLDGDYVLMNDLTPECEGYDDYNERRENYTKRSDAGWGETWDEGDTIDIPFYEDDYESILSVEDEDGDSISYTVDHPTITIEEDTEERYIYVEYEDAVIGWEAIGDYDEDVEFTGTFDGQNHTIEGLYTNRPDSNDVGLFGGTEDVNIMNLGVLDAKVRGYSRVGILIGGHDGAVRNSYATGDVIGENWFVGGLIGTKGGGTVINSYATANVSGEVRIGGLAGNNNGQIFDSYASGNVSGRNIVGGLVGSNQIGTVVNSYATGGVNGNENVGGLVGVGGTEENSFWDIDATGQDESDGGTGKTTAEMKNVATYTYTDTEGLDNPWDFIDDPYDDEGDEDIWDIDEEGEINDGYPFLSWQEEQDEHELTINIEGEGSVEVNGQEVRDGWSGAIEEYDVTLTALPDEGHEFVEWDGTDETDETGEEITITMDEDKELTAHFEIKTYNLTVDTVGEGTVDIEPEKEEYEHGEEVTLTALPDEGHEFVEWDGTDEAGEEITITMYDDKELAAHFQINTYDLTVDTVGEGTVDIEPEKEEYEHGEEVNLTALPDEGHEFVEWDGTDETGEEITITMYDDKELAAHFQIKTYSVEIDIEGEGSVEIDPEQDEYEHGEEIELTPEPDEGHEFDHWVINGEVYEEEKIELEMYEDIDITVHFEEDEGIGISLYLVLAVSVLVIILVSVLLMKRGKTSSPETEDEYLDEDLSEDI